MYIKYWIGFEMALLEESPLVVCRDNFSDQRYHRKTFELYELISFEYNRKEVFASENCSI